MQGTGKANGDAETMISKISNYPIVNWLLAVKRDYGIARGYVGFLWDSVQFILLIILVFPRSVPVVWIVLFGIVLSAFMVLVGGLFRRKNIPQRENSLMNEMSPQIMEILERVKNIENRK